MTKQNNIPHNPHYAEIAAKMGSNDFDICTVEAPFKVIGDTVYHKGVEVATLTGPENSHRYALVKHLRGE